MSGVDVLAVMDRAVTFAAAYNLPNSAEDYAAALAAVAELIEADREYDAAENEAVAHHTGVFKQDKAWREMQAEIEARCERAIARRAAALARATAGSEGR